MGSRPPVAERYSRDLSAWEMRVGGVETYWIRHSDGAIVYTSDLHPVEMSDEILNAVVRTKQFRREQVSR